MKNFILYAALLTLLLGLNIQKAHAQTEAYKLMHQGNKFFRARQYDKASTYYMQALKKNPDNARATFNLADVYLAKGNSQAADSLYNRVTQLEKNKQVRSMAWHNRGYIRQVQALHAPKQQQELLRVAIDHYKQALRLNPSDNDTRYNLALCQKQLKDSEQDNQQQQQQKDNQSGQNNNPQQQKQQSRQAQPENQDKQQTRQYLNLARQAERRALEKLNGRQPRQKSLDKNW